MLLVKTYVDKSPIEGVGLFAGEFIKKGTSVAVFHPWIDRPIELKQYELLPKVAKENIKRYSDPYPEGTDIFYLFQGDNIKYMNHSFKPNISRNCFARMDIPEGVELTINYYQIDHRTEWLDKILK